MNSNMVAAHSKVEGYGTHLSLRKVNGEYQSEITLTVRVNSDKVAHPKVLVKWE